MRPAIATTTAIAFVFATGSVWLLNFNWFGTLCGGISFSFSYYYSMRLFEGHKYAYRWTPALILLAYFLLLTIKREAFADSLALGESWFNIQSDLTALAGCVIGVPLANILFEISNSQSREQKDSGK